MTTRPRFTIDKRTVRGFRGPSPVKTAITGYCVFDGKDRRPSRRRRITIPFKTKAEAKRHMKRIAELYERWGW
jgi:hypothetical protein